MIEKVNLKDAFEQIPEPWKPRIAGSVNDVIEREPATEG